MPTTAKIASRVARDCRMLRRAIDSTRNGPVTENRLLAVAILNGAKKTNTDNGTRTVWEPDASGSYGHSWTRDMSMCMEGFLDYFGADEIEQVATYFLGKSNAPGRAGEVPDHISHMGQVFWTPGHDNNWGSRAPVDGNTYLLQMFWLHYVQTGSPDLYGTHRKRLRYLIEQGIPYNHRTGCVSVSDASPFVGFGFYDTVKMTGDVLFPSILAYRAYLQMAELELALGADDNEVLRLQQRADTIRNGINSEMLRFYDIGDPIYRKLAFYRASTLKCSRQLDLWGSAFAVWSEVPPEGVARMIAGNIAGIAAANQDNVRHGGVRHVVKDSDQERDKCCWESYFHQPDYGAYQNGGFWFTATPWLCHALALIDPVAAQLHYKNMIDYSINQGNTRPWEWFSAAGQPGVPKYGTSAVAPLMMGDRMPFYNNT